MKPKPKKYRPRRGRLFTKKQYAYLDSAKFMDSLDKTFGNNQSFRNPYDLGWKNTHGFIPVLVLVLAGLAVAFAAGAAVQRRVIDQTMICHAPGDTK